MWKKIKKGLYQFSLVGVSECVLVYYIDTYLLGGDIKALQRITGDVAVQQNILDRCASTDFLVIARREEFFYMKEFVLVSEAQKDAENQYVKYNIF